uniref:Uncharacterized protein n=1 Tax=Setaria digitata TaxID=48799 RepID=A0A915Q1X7_9BILA
MKEQIEQRISKSDWKSVGCGRAIWMDAVYELELLLQRSIRECQKERGEAEDREQDKADPSMSQLLEM